jgi:hypothetical protein
MTITAALGVVASAALVLREPLGIVIEFLCLMALAAAAVRLGSLRADDAASVTPAASPRHMPGAAKRTHFREFVHDGAHQAKQ